MTTPTLLQKHEVIDALHAEVKKHPTRKIAASKLGCTEAQLSMTLNDKTDVIPARILKALKLQMVTVYVAKDDAKKLGRQKATKKAASRAAASGAATAPSTAASTSPPTASATTAPTPAAAPPQTPAKPPAVIRHEPKFVARKDDSVINIRD